MQLLFLLLSVCLDFSSAVFLRNESEIMCCKSWSISDTFALPYIFSFVVGGSSCMTG